MSKRIFTVILALVLSLTALSFGAEANSSVAANSEAGDGTLITGNNCTLNVGATFSIVNWNPVDVATGYSVIYSNDDTGTTMNASMSSAITTATIPLGYSNCGNFTVTVIYFTSAGNGIAASVRYSGGIIRDEPDYTESYTTNLTLIQKLDGKIRVSWNAVSDVAYYVVTYFRIDQAVPEDQYVINTYYDMPFGRSVGFVLNVYAYTKEGKMESVGEAVHIAGDKINGEAIGDTDKIAVAFDIPVYGFYGYLTAGDYMKLDLPTYFGDYVPAGLGINWYLQIDGTKYTLQKSTTTSGGAAISANANRVYLGVIGHDFDGQDTAIPQSIAYNQYSSFRLVAELDSFSYPKNPDGSYKTVDEIINVGSLFNGNNPVYGRPASSIKADWYKADDTPVPGSTSYVFNWSATVAVIGSSSGQTPTPTPDPTPAPTVCEHAFEYQSCTEVHWKHCTKCGYTCEVGEHSAANGSCSICGRSSTTSRFDVNGDGQVNLQDAVMILRRLAHLD